MKDELTLQVKIVQTEFKQLRAHIGKKVIIEHYSYGRLETDIFIIEQVHDYRGVEFDCMYMPFIGRDCAIKRISTLDGKKLYEARGLYEPYGHYDQYELIEIARRVFGSHEAEKR